jgi:hypothetical protein
MDAIANNVEIAGCLVSDHRPAPPKRGRKLRLINRELLDGRTAPYKEFQRLSSAIVADLGGESNLSAIELALVEAFCGASIVVNHINTELMLGNAIDFTDHSTAVGAMVRVASRLGLQRRSRPVNEVTLGEILRDDFSRQQPDADRDEASP